MSAKPLAAALRGAVAAHVVKSLPDPRSHAERRDAAVLVPVRLEPEPVVTLVLRSPRLRDHAGEVSFPGGKPEPGDDGLVGTALREAEEEIGLAPSDVELLGPLAAVPVATSLFRLNPFVGLVASSAPPWRTSEELVRAIDVPVRAVADGRIELRAVPIRWAGIELDSPFLELADDAVLFGATAWVLVELLTLLTPLMGLELPPPRIVREPPWAWTPNREQFRPGGS